MKLCEKLYELRRAAGLSQEELAERLNVSRQAVSKWENGAAQPELSKLVELSRLYGVSVDELLSLEEAEKGKNVCLVSSGDAGVYGMAGLVLQMSVEYPALAGRIQIIPGVTAALSGAALLGSPLTNDFCTISLSDLLTPKEEIERRLKGAALGDFAIVLYNPSSRRRRDYLKRACDILLSCGLPESRPCGIVRSIGREGQEAQIVRLGELAGLEVDMFTTVFIGNSHTRIIGDRLVTPRGYRLTENKG